MGKGPHFAWKLHTLEKYLIAHQTLPPSQTQAHLQETTLLDNEAMCQAIHECLTAADIGAVSPLLFMKDVNNGILLALDIAQVKTSIMESTAHRWLDQTWI